MRTFSIAALSFILGGSLGYLIATGREVGKDEAVLKKESSISESQRIAQGVEIPRVDFEQTSLDEAVDYLRSKTRGGIQQNDEEVISELNFIVVDPDELARPIDLQMQEVKLDVLCERIAQLSGFQVTFDDDAVVFSNE